MIVVMCRFAFTALLLFVLQAGGSIISLTSESSSSLKDANPSPISTANASLAKRSDYSNNYHYLQPRHPNININPEGNYPSESTSTEELSFGRNVPADYHLRDQPQAIRNANANGQLAYPRYTPGWGWCLYTDNLPRNPTESYLIVDHVLEIQIVTKTMNAVNVDMDRYTSGEISAMRSIMNGRENVFYIPNYLNCVKSHITKRMLQDILTTGRCRALDLSSTHRDWADHNALKTYVEGACQDIIDVGKTMVPLIRSAGYDHTLLNIDEISMKILRCIGVDVRKINGAIKCPAYKICKPE